MTRPIAGPHNLWDRPAIRCKKLVCLGHPVDQSGAGPVLWDVRSAGTIAAPEGSLFMDEPPATRHMPEVDQRRTASVAKAEGAVETRLRVDTYMAAVQPIGPSSRDLLHELTVSVFWPHRAGDLDLFLSLGKGWLALDEIGRPLSSAMYFPMGDDFAMFGMMVTPPRLQAQGAGRHLLRRILHDCRGRDLRLSATRSGYRLYESAGFAPVGAIRQQQGLARPIHLPDPVPGLELVPVAPDDAAVIAALDVRAYGADRGAALAALLAVSSGLIGFRGGVPVGFALMRRFGKGLVIGPVVAEDDAMAMALVAPLAQQAAGRFLRLDTPVDSEQFSAFLAAAGMGVFDTVTEMRIGPQRRATAGPVTYGLASHSLG
jgi:GNAT superfamily N-acetyltransferase